LVEFDIERAADVAFLRIDNALVALARRSGESLPFRGRVALRPAIGTGDATPFLDQGK
jgi:hypothetical protein